MLKSTLIAKCLYQCRMVPNVEAGENAVQSIFAEYFPSYSYKNWNTSVPDNVVSHYLRISKGSSQTRVDSFIKDLWDL